jgi:mRNA-degrading endonuclease RelE of RelBE toxin-antitoxin system
MPWQIKLSAEAIKQLTNQPANRQRQIARAISAISEDPFQGNVRPLRGKRWQGRFRKTAGRYRIIFQVDHDQEIINMSAILLRSDQTYR